MHVDCGDQRLLSLSRLSKQTTGKGDCWALHVTHVYFSHYVNTHPFLLPAYMLEPIYFQTSQMSKALGMTCHST